MKLRSVFRRIRVRKEESAYIYFILEAQEGIVAYSTLPHETGSPFRELELQIPPDFVSEVEELLESLQTELGDALAILE